MTERQHLDEARHGLERAEHALRQMAERRAHYLVGSIAEALLHLETIATQVAEEERREAREIAADYRRKEAREEPRFSVLDMALVPWGVEA